MAQPPQSARPVPSSEPPLPQLAPQSASATPPPPPAPTPAAGGSPVGVTAALQNTPSVAADNDVIESEWIAKAKQVVAETHDDPYKQVQQMNLLKADYMQKRYNKIVKLPGS